MSAPPPTAPAPAPPPPPLPRPDWLQGVEGVVPATAAILLRGGLRAALATALLVIPAALVIAAALGIVLLGRSAFNEATEPVSFGLAVVPATLVAIVLTGLGLAIWAAGPYAVFGLLLRGEPLGARRLLALILRRSGLVGFVVLFRATSLLIIFAISLGLKKEGAPSVRDVLESWFAFPTIALYCALDRFVGLTMLLAFMRPEAGRDVLYGEASRAFTRRPLAVAATAVAPLVLVCGVFMGPLSTVHALQGGAIVASILASWFIDAASTAGVVSVDLE